MLDPRPDATAVAAAAAAPPPHRAPSPGTTTRGGRGGSRRRRWDLTGRWAACVDCHGARVFRPEPRGGDSVRLESVPVPATHPLSSRRGVGPPSSSRGSRVVVGPASCGQWEVASGSRDANHAATEAKRGCQWHGNFSFLKQVVSHNCE